MRPLFFLLLAAGPAWAAESALPQPAPPGRYDQTLAQSPFALATKVEAPVAPSETFAANWVLTGISKMPDDQGVMQDFITVRSRDQRVAFSVFGAETSGDKEGTGVSIAKVERAEDSRKSYVMLKKGQEVARVEFNQEVSAATAMPPGVAANMGIGLGRPGFPPVGGNVPATGGVMNNQARSNTLARPSLPRPAAGPGAGGPGGGGPGSMGAAGGPGSSPATVNPATGEHRRVRVISSQPQ